ncbi:uncharacterized protein LOC124898481 [Capsicum annuum]|uniref:uncharacterized protein LOC124898481 n=1 Tax=Capsicum annuum TaxID=4072 RepID=UPI001FB0D6AD|nr:uncharacterized protein LOC124898481 [Capsicum annuum]
MEESPIWMDCSITEQCKAIEVSIGDGLELARLAGSRAHERYFNEKSSSPETNTFSVSCLCSVSKKTPFTALAPPVFKGEGYHVMSARMEKHMEANDLWEAVEEDYEVTPLPENPTMAIMTLKLAFEVWNFLKKEYEGDKRIKGIRTLNLIREFELQKMQDSETIKEYSDRLLNIGNNAQEQRRLMRGTKRDFPPCKHYGKKSHPPFKCWRRPDQQYEKCQQMVDHQKVFKNTQQTNAAQLANQEDEEKLFVATCLETSCSSDKWFIYSGCTNHMTFDRDFFKELDTSVISKVQVGNGNYIPAEGKGTVEMKCSLGTKLIKDVFFVPNISHSLLSVGQMLENGFKLLFETNYCQIKDEDGRNLFKVMMKGRSFTLDLLDHE